MNKQRTPPPRKAALQALLQYIGRLLPNDQERAAFYQCAQTPPPASLRLNALQAQARPLRPHLHQRGQSVPWCREGFALPDGNARLGQTIEHAMGAYYVQAKAPMLAVEVLAPQPGERVLDLCAAPGGKATQIAARMQNSGLLLVNEMQRKRLPALVGNLERCGVANHVLTQAPGTLLTRYFPNFFDRVLVDAPCSGDGIVRKDQSMLAYWSPHDAQRLAQQQIGLLRAAYAMLRPGGTLVYSTCSLSLEENEAVLLGVLRRYGDEVAILPIPAVAERPLPAVLASQFPAEFARCARIWPHRHDTEGAFVACLSKRAPTPSPEDAPAWDASTTDAAATEARRAIESRWGGVLPCPADQIFTLGNRHLCRQPALGPALQAQLPHFVRSGMRTARCHKGYYYLSQQTVALWGHRMQGPSVELSWPQLQDLFKGRPIECDPSTGLKGEVFCRFGPWTACRAIAREQGRRLEGMLPRALFRANLERLV